MKVNKIIVSIFLLSVGHFACADDGVSKQIQMLNSQIQSQLQQMQSAQNKVDTKLNAQIQAQLKKVQTDLQKQIDDAYTKTQNQIKTIQDTFQKQLTIVNSNIQKATSGNTTNTKQQ